MAAGDVDFKRRAVELLVAELREELVVLRQAAMATREAATHEDAKPENDKDTRAIEAGYLAGAQAARVLDLERDVDALGRMTLRSFTDDAPVALGAVVEVELAGAPARYFLAPRGGGRRATVDGTRLTVVTPESALGRALLGKVAGDVAEVEAAGGTRECEIVAVR